MIQKIIKIKDWLAHNPKHVFIDMVALIILSLANFVRRAAKPKSTERKSISERVDVTSGFDMGFSSIIDETMLLKQTYNMQKSIDSLLAKEELTDKDSLMLMQKIQELQSITQSKFK